MTYDRISDLLKKDEPTLKKDTANCSFDKHAEREVGDDDVSFGVSVEDLADLLPSFDERRRILATDALASVEGFRVMVQLTMQHLFGVFFLSKVSRLCYLYFAMSRSFW